MFLLLIFKVNMIILKFTLYYLKHRKVTFLVVQKVDFVICRWKKCQHYLCTDVNVRLRTVSRNRDFSVKFEIISKNIHILSFCNRFFLFKNNKKSVNWNTIFQHFVFQNTHCLFNWVKFKIMPCWTVITFEKKTA